MNFTYNIIEKSLHEPTLVVLFTPENTLSEARYGKVYFEPASLVGKTEAEVVSILHNLIVSHAPVDNWNRMLELDQSTTTLDAALAASTGAVVEATEYSSVVASNSAVLDSPSEVEVI